MLVGYSENYDPSTLGKISAILKKKKKFKNAVVSGCHLVVL